MVRTSAVVAFVGLIVAMSPEGRGELRHPSNELFEQYQKIELTFFPPSGSSFAIDRPDDFPISAHFTAPSGRVVTIGGFFSRGRLRVRFTPTEVGHYRYLVELDRQRYLGAFDVRRSASAGFLRVVGRALKFTEGSTFIPLGENRMNVFDRSWNYAQKDIDGYLAYMKRNGMNALRVFTFSDCYAENAPTRPQLGCLEPTLGRFDERTAEAIDEILEAGRRHGVFVVLTAYAIGFTPGDAWKGWQDNPYSTERGGPAAEPIDFLRSVEARRAAARRLRYLADRWAYSPNLLAIDLLNEPEWDGQLSERQWTPWAEEMAAVWRAHDPYRHPITLGSVGLQHNIDGDERDWYRSAKDDIVQWHLYGRETYEVHALAAEMSKKVKETLAFEKPVLCGEFGYGGEDKKSYDHTHVGIWSVVLSGGGVLAHSAPPFQVDSDEPMTPERGRHFAVLRQFLDRIGHEPLTPRALEVSGGVVGWSLRGASRMGLWLLAPKATYEKSVDAAEVSIADLGPGRYQVSWWDDTTGRLLLKEEMLVAGEGRLRLVAPRFHRHIAATIRRQF